MYMSFTYATRCQPIYTAKLVETFQDAFRKKKICEDDSKGMALYNIKNMKIKIDPP